MTRKLDDLAKKQVPFAAAQALNETAQMAQISVRRQLPSIFDRPTPFTMNAIGIQRATKGRLEARVFVKDKQAEYLKVQEDGGTRIPKKRAILLPRAIRLNQYGNMARGAIAAARAKPNVFSGKVEGVPGLYQRLKKGAAKLLARYIDRATYKPRFGFKKRMLKTASGVWPSAFRRSLAKALATARK
ncbi:hypothetical protein HMPREF9946_04003 [Acetobacteraceae bacterium AT-5844]|nr:hypothetical protein HMPREF9946_04003 [Acetobacteraceae bacterium AT-5844]